MDNQPKFIMQVNRQEPVPKLVSINEFSSTQSKFINSQKNRPYIMQKNGSNMSKDCKSLNNNLYNSQLEPFMQEQIFTDSKQIQSRNGLATNERQNLIGYDQNSKTFQNHTNAASPYFYTTVRKQLPVTEPKNYRLQCIQLQKLLQIQNEEKLQLQQIIKDQTIQSQKLKQINEHIVDRLKELQKNFVQQKIQQQKQQAQRVRKAVSQAYRDVQYFLRSQIQILTQNLKEEKMTPLLEKKIELFLQSMLQINQNTVQMFKMSQRRNLNVSYAEPSLFKQKPQQKQNLFYSSIQTKNRIKLFSDNKKGLENSRRRSSSKKIRSSPQSGRKLINNAYISSSLRRRSPSRLLFQTNEKKQQMPEEYSNVLKHLQNSQQFRNEAKVIEPLYKQIEFQNPFLTKSQNPNARKAAEMRDSGKEMKKYFETSNYENKNFHVKEYTPGKRKRIFEGKSKSKIFDADYD